MSVAGSTQATILDKPLLMPGTPRQRTPSVVVGRKPHHRFHTAEALKLAATIDQLFTEHQRPQKEQALRLLLVQDAHIGGLLIHCNELSHKTRELEGTLKHTRTAMAALQRQLDLVTEDCDRKLTSFKVLANMKADDSKRARVVTEVQSIAMGAQDTAMRSLRRELDAKTEELEGTKRQLAELQFAGGSRSSGGPSTSPVKTSDSRGSSFASSAPGAPSLASSASSSRSSSAAVLPPILSRRQSQKEQMEKFLLG